MRTIPAIFLLLCVSCGSSGTPAPSTLKLRQRSVGVANCQYRASLAARPLRTRQAVNACRRQVGSSACVRTFIPDVALNMFKPGTRWKRLYMLARAEAVQCLRRRFAVGRQAGARRRGDCTQAPRQHR